jgi:enoyl-CoA hydratase/long-chain 3-hydroxyacyl-CoA dehydrogenase
MLNLTRPLAAAAARRGLATARLGATAARPRVLRLMATQAASGKTAAPAAAAAAPSKPTATQTPPPATTPAAAAASKPITTPSGKALKHMSFVVEEGGIAVITFDQQGSKVNTLNREVGEDFLAVFTQLQNDPAIRAAVVISGKEADFIAGADINMFDTCSTQEDMENLVRPVHELFDGLESGKPVVAAINGNCLGGGLEFALACHYRIASESPKTGFALPEVMLGILPGAGGTQRLPKLCGLQESLPLILTGKRINPRKAKKIKLVDQTADPKALRFAAVQAARNLADGKLKPDRSTKGMVPRLTKAVLESTDFGSNFVFKKAHEMVMKNTKGVYPAPLKIIDVLKTSLKHGFGSKEGFEAEVKAFAELGMTSESQALRSIFHGQNACKKNPYDAKAAPVGTLGVLGAGLMGAGVAEVAVGKGLTVVLKDANLDGLGRGLEQIDSAFRTKVKRRKMESFEKDKTMSRVIGVTDDDATWKQSMAKADYVIEAVFEDLSLKHRIVKEIEAATSDKCIFASNTSPFRSPRLPRPARARRILLVCTFSRPCPRWRWWRLSQPPRPPRRRWPPPTSWR